MTPHEPNSPSQPQLRKRLKNLKKQLKEQGLYKEIQDKPKSEYAVLGLILGLLSEFLFWLPIIFPPALLIGPFGIGMSIVGIRDTGKSKKESGRGIAIAGLVCTVIGMVPMGLFFFDVAQSNFQI